MAGTTFCKQVMSLLSLFQVKGKQKLGGRARPPLCLTMGYLTRVDVFKKAFGRGKGTARGGGRSNSTFRSLGVAGIPGVPPTVRE